MDRMLWRIEEMGEDRVSAYFAGLFDGEGCVRLSTRRSPVLKVSIVNTDARPLRHLHRQFGGSITEHTWGARHGRPWRRSYEWQVAAGIARSFLRWIAPYVLIKREQVDIALEFLATRRADRSTKRLTPEEQALYEGFRLALQTAKHEC